MPTLVVCIFYCIVYCVFYRNVCCIAYIICIVHFEDFHPCALACS
jgi:hypothetical protein